MRGYVFPYIFPLARRHLSSHSSVYCRRDYPLKGVHERSVVLRRTSRFKSHPFAAGESYIIAAGKEYRARPDVSFA